MLDVYFSVGAKNYWVIFCTSTRLALFFSSFLCAEITRNWDAQTIFAIDRLVSLGCICLGLNKRVQDLTIGGRYECSSRQRTLASRLCALVRV